MFGGYLKLVVAVAIDFFLLLWSYFAIVRALHGNCIFYCILLLPFVGTFTRSIGLLKRVCGRINAHERVWIAIAHYECIVYHSTARHRTVHVTVTCMHDYISIVFFSVVRLFVFVDMTVLLFFVVVLYCRIQLWLLGNCLCRCYSFSYCSIRFILPLPLFSLISYCMNIIFVYYFS